MQMKELERQHQLQERERERERERECWSAYCKSWLWKKMTYFLNQRKLVTGRFQLDTKKEKCLGSGRNDERNTKINLIWNLLWCQLWTECRSTLLKISGHSGSFIKCWRQSCFLQSKYADKHRRFKQKQFAKVEFESFWLKSGLNGLTNRG